jgi:hypothetical protein
VAIGRKLETHKLNPRLSNTFCLDLYLFHMKLRKVLGWIMSYFNNGRVHSQDRNFYKRKIFLLQLELLLDNVPSHPHAKLISKSVCASFLLQNVTANGPRCVRMFKKCRLLQSLLEETGNEDSVFSYSNQMNLKGANAY